MHEDYNYVNTISDGNNEFAVALTAELKEIMYCTKIKLKAIIFYYFLKQEQQVTGEARVEAASGTSTVNGLVCLQKFNEHTTCV